MKTYNKILSFLLVVLLLLMASGCKTEYFVTEKSFFNTTFYMATDKTIKEDTKQNIFSFLQSMEDSFSISKENSFISKFNALEENESIEISCLEKNLLNACKNCYEFTNGAFNPATLSLLKSWKLSSDTFNNKTVFITPPTSLEIEKGLSTLPYFELLNFESDNLVKVNKDLQIDLGGVAKGYAVDEIVKMLKDTAISKGYISIGGSSIYIYRTDENLKVTHPRKGGEYILSIDKNTLSNVSLSTSGDYVRFYMGKNGERFSHIIDTKTGSPTNTGFASVTVIGKNAQLTDAISTALCTFTKQEFLDFTKNKLLDCKVYAVYEKEKVVLTNANESEFTLNDNEYKIEYIK